jgi:hypothetical protein
MRKLFLLRVLALTKTVKNIDALIVIEPLLATMIVHCGLRVLASSCIVHLSSSTLRFIKAGIVHGIGALRGSSIISL